MNSFVSRPPLLFLIEEIFLFLPVVSRQTLDDDLAPTNNNHMWQSRPVAEWDNQQVCLWLTTMDMEKYRSEFAARGVDGSQLLSLDGEKLKVSIRRGLILYISSSFGCHSRSSASISYSFSIHISNP